MGNGYVKDEFRRHCKAEESFIPIFLKEWTAYRDTLLQQVSVPPHEPGASHIGRQLGKAELDALSPEQLGQLQELREASKGRDEGSN